MVEIAPSLMCMNITKFTEQINFLNSAADYYHIDIMDGHYVDNMTLSPWFIEQLRESSTLPIEAHLMVTNPIEYIPKLIKLDVDLISIHAEHLNGQAFRISNQIKSAGKKLGVVINPETPLMLIDDYLSKVDTVTIMTVDPGFAGQQFIKESIKKIEDLKKKREEDNLNFSIQIDGSCNKTTYNQLISAGADRLVLGSSGLFNLDENLEMAYSKMLEDINQSMSV